MDHVVYLDTKANELEKLLNGTKKMIIRGRPAGNYLMEKYLKVIIFFLLTIMVKGK